MWEDEYDINVCIPWIFYNYILFTYYLNFKWAMLAKQFCFTIIDMIYCNWNWRLNILAWRPQSKLWRDNLTALGDFHDLWLEHLLSTWNFLEPQADDTSITANSEVRPIQHPNIMWPILKGVKATSYKCRGMTHVLKILEDEPRSQNF